MYIIKSDLTTILCINLFISHSKASPGNLIQLEDILFSNAETLVSGGVAGLKIANDEGELVSN